MTSIVRNLPTLFYRIFKYLVRSKYLDKDQTRQAFILNVLLFGSIILSFVALLSSSIGKILIEKKGDVYPGISPLILFILLIIFVIAYFISLLGKSRQVSYTLICFYLLVAAYTG